MSDALRTMNPLNVRGTAMPPNLLLMAKVVTVVFLVSYELSELSDHFVPLLGFFADLGSPLTFRRVLQVGFVVAAVSLLLNRRVRTSSFVLGAVIWVSILSSHLYYENNRMFAASILLLAGLSSPGRRWSLVQLQVIVLYFGAALNKVLSTDWLTGQFFDTWAGLSSWGGAYGDVSSLLPSMGLAILMSWIAIVTEIVLLGAFCIPRLFPFAIWLGVAYHTGLFLITGRTFGLFWFAILSSYLAFVAWPAAPILVRRGRDAVSALAAAVTRLDFERGFELQRASHATRLSVVVGDREHHGLDGLVRVLLHSPAVYLAFAVVSARPGIGGRWAGLVAVLLLAQIAYGWARQLLRARAATRVATG